ncbi:MAG: DEAD/DEAH box helicase [Lysobacteraceae bacterium]
MSFQSLGLSPALLRPLVEQGYTAPTPIQERAIPLALAGHDLLAGAQTGTGKTAAFGLPLLQRLMTGGQARARLPRALVLAPTRELAVQVHDSLKAYARQLPLQLAAIYGGAGMGPQLHALRRGVVVLVATPGRLIDHIERRSVDLSQVEVLVLDEADRMLDMGFLPAIRRILGSLPRQRQTLLFSATFEPAIKALARDFMRSPQEVMVAPDNTIAETITHRVHPVDASRKRELLLHLLGQDSRRQTLVFSKTKHGANRLAEQILKSGIRAVAIHGNKSQGARLKALKDFKDGRATVMVATDVAARGIDIDELPVVINYDLPMVAGDYVHRIGRTGRAGANGEAVSLVSSEESGLLRDIQKLLGRDIEQLGVEGFEPREPLRLGGSAPRGAPRPQGRGRGRGHAGRPGRARSGSGNPARRSQ